MGILKSKAKLLVLAILLLVLLGTFTYFQFFNLNTNPQNLSKYTKFASINDMQTLLLKEKTIIYPPFSSKASFGNLHQTEKVIHGDILYTFDGNNDYFNNPSTRPFQYASFSRMVVNDHEWVIIGVRVLNRDRSISFLHYGFSTVDFNNPKIVNSWGKQFQDPNKYLLPYISVQDCAKHVYFELVCSNYDQRTKDLLRVWVNTGVVPDELQTKILLPEISLWSPVM